MGEARRRGTREERVAQGIARREAWQKAQAEERERLKIERRRIASERQRLMTNIQTDNAVLAAGTPASLTSELLHALLATASAGAASASPIYAIRRRPE